MLPDLVYLIHEAENEPLRYSLRSLVQHGAQFRRVWVVGVLPDWIENVGHIPVEEPGEKFASIRAKLEAAVSDRRVATNIVIMNDDHVATAPFEAWGAYHLGPTSKYIAEHGRMRNTWWLAMRETAEWMRDRGHGDILCYAGHVPLMYSKAKLRALLGEYPRGRRLLDVGLYPEAGVGGEGVLALNAKCGTDDVWKLDDDRMPPWVSTNDASFAGEIGDRIRAALPEASRFEKG